MNSNQNKDKNKILNIGSKRQVWNGSALKTSGGLKKSDLMQNKHGKVVSIKQYNAGLKATKNLPQPY